MQTTSESVAPIAPDTYTPTDRSRVRRRPERGFYDRTTVHSIIDEAIVCHVAFVVDGEPRMIPTSIVRIGEDVFLHGSPNNRMLTVLASGMPACITVTHVDAIVAGRSGFGCSVDYRSVVIYSSGSAVEGPEKVSVLDAVIQSIIPGHRVRSATSRELGATLVLRFPLIDVSAKVRACGVRDLEEDYDLDLWAGVIPLKLTAESARSDPRLKPGISTPLYALTYRGRAQSHADLRSAP